MDGFLLSMPCWVIVHNFKSGRPFWRAICRIPEKSGVRSVTLFTDSDLATSFIAGSKLKNAAIMEAERDELIAAFALLQSDGISDVIIDPNPTTGRTGRAPIGEVIECLRRGG